MLPVPLRPVVGLAEHLAIADACRAAAAPCRHVVGVHLRKLPDAGMVGTVGHGAVRAVGDAFSPGVGGLPLYRFHANRSSIVTWFCMSLEYALWVSPYVVIITV